jgi:hypothetical protein
MGGAVSGLVNPISKFISGGKSAISQTAQNVADATSDKPAETKASRMDEEQGARMRGARRRGRQLLSDARLNPETGTQTLGGGNNLG